MLSEFGSSIAESYALQSCFIKAKILDWFRYNLW